MGALELPPSAELILLLRGRIVTAGYPVIAVATRTSRDVLGHDDVGHVGPGEQHQRCLATIAVQHQPLPSDCTALTTPIRSMSRLSQSRDRSVQRCPDDPQNRI